MARGRTLAVYAKDDVERNKYYLLKVPCYRLVCFACGCCCWCVQGALRALRPRWVSAPSARHLTSALPHLPTHPLTHPLQADGPVEVLAADVTDDFAQQYKRGDRVVAGEGPGVGAQPSAGAAAKGVLAGRARGCWHAEHSGLRGGKGGLARGALCSRAPPPNALQPTPTTEKSRPL